MDSEIRSFQGARNLQWLFLAVAASALAFGGQFARTVPYSLALASGAVLNGLSYLVPLDRLTRRQVRFALAVELPVHLAVISFAIAFSGGTASPLYAFLLLTLVIPAVGARTLDTAVLSLLAITGFALAGVFSSHAFDPVPQAFIKIALLFGFPVGMSVMLAGYRRRMRDRESFSTLYGISRSLGETLDLRQVLHSLLGHMDDIFKTDISSVRLLDPARNTLVVKASGADSEEIQKEQIEIRVGEGFIGWVGKSGQPFITSDITRDPRFADFPRARKKVTSAIAVPIKIADRTVGVISCASGRRKRFSADDLGLLISVASLAGGAIERADLYEQLLSRGEAVVQGMGDGLLVVDGESRIVMTNRTAREMLDIAPEWDGPLSSAIEGRITEWKRIVRDIDNRIINAPGTPSPFSLEVTTSGDPETTRVLSARISPVTSRWDKVIGAVILLEDVTDLIRLTGELALEKAKLETVLENAVVGVLAVSESGEVLIANSSLFNMLGKARPWWWLGSPLEEVVTEPGLTRLIKKAMFDDAPVLNERLVLASERHVEISCVPIDELASGKPGTVAVMHDVTGIHRVEQAKSDFVSMVSHELRTPLTSIKAYVDTLQRQDVNFEEETRAGFISVIARETERMTRLINDMLDLSRIEAGRLDLKATFVNLPELVRKVAIRMEPHVAGHNIVLDLPPDVDRVFAEPEKMEQVMFNLIGNALKYSPEGSDVTISVKSLKEKAMVSVADNGMGIASDHLPYIFDKYHRAGQTNGDIRGAGLGLYVTKSIVEAHGGRIWAESGGGTGTTVMFTVPFATVSDGKQVGGARGARAIGDESA